MNRRIEGELTNRLAESSKQPHPEVGMGATIMYYSDRKPVTVAVLDLSGMGEIKAIYVREDKAIRSDSNGMSDQQAYRFEPDPTAPLKCFTLRRNGSWVLKGEPSRDGLALALGFRDAYHDYSF